MQHTVHPQRLRPVLRPHLIAVAALVSGILVAGCGAAAPSPTAATAAGATTSASTVAAGAARTTGSGTGTRGEATSSRSNAAGDSQAEALLAFARCMRANGVPNFPDPRAGSGAAFPIPAGTSPAAPAFHAAQAKCQTLLPDDGLPGAGSTPPSAQTLAKLLRIARCMRGHGISQFPDPKSSRPSNLSPDEYSEVTDFDGATLLFPRTINMQSPAYKQALLACDAPPLGLPH
jgi:hypothetical protein